MERDGVSCVSCMSMAISGRGLMLINARLRDWSLLMAGLFGRPALGISYPESATFS